MCFNLERFQQQPTLLATRKQKVEGEVGIFNLTFLVLDFLYVFFLKLFFLRHGITRCTKQGFNYCFSLCDPTETLLKRHYFLNHSVCPKILTFENWKILFFINSQICLLSYLQLVVNLYLGLCAVRGSLLQVVSCNLSIELWKCCHLGVSVQLPC